MPMSVTKARSPSSPVGSALITKDRPVFLCTYCMDHDGNEITSLTKAFPCAVCGTRTWKQVLQP